MSLATTTPATPGGGGPSPASVAAVAVAVPPARADGGGAARRWQWWRPFAAVDDAHAAAPPAAALPAVAAAPAAAAVSPDTATREAARRRREDAARAADIESGDTLLAGALAGLVSETLMHPFDTVSLRAKVHPSSAYGNLSGAFRLIFKQEGMRGYFAGVSATVWSSIPSNAVYFTVYETLKNALNAATDHRHESAVYFAAGGLSEVAASLLVAPVEVVKARLQLGVNPHRATGGLVGASTNFASVPAALAGVYRERGLPGLVAGWNAGLAMDMSYSATQFMLYESIKARLTAGRRVNDDDDSAHPTTAETLGAGCVAGGIAAVVTNPLDVITSRLMVQDHGHRYGGGMWEVARQTVAEGPVAMWRGTLPRAAQLAPMSALSFAVYEAARLLLHDGHSGSGGSSSGGGDASVSASSSSRAPTTSGGGGTTAARPSIIALA